jgi:N-acetylmuramoyl-L-alanine amidase
MVAAAAASAARWSMPLLCLLASMAFAVPPVAPQPNNPAAPAAFVIAPAAAFVILIDPAHGGADPGARLADGAAEKDANIELAQRLRALLEERGFTVVTTRPLLPTGQPETELTSDQRAAVANHAHAQACLILHATATGNGLHLFNSSLAPQDPTHAARVFTDWQTAQSASITRSIALASEINAAFTHTGIPVTVGRTYLPPMDSMTCPVVAVEVAPFTPKNSHDHKDPDDPGYSQRVAETLVWSLEQWRSHVTGNPALDDSLNPERNTTGTIKIQQQPAPAGGSR